MDLDKIFENKKIEKQNFKKQLIHNYEKIIKNYDWNKVADDIMNNKFHHVPDTYVGQYEYFSQYECCKLFKKLLNIEIDKSNFICVIRHYGNINNSSLCIYENKLWVKISFWLN